MSPESMFVLFLNFLQTKTVYFREAADWCSINAPVAQWIRRRPPKAKIAGSNPARG